MMKPITFLAILITVLTVNTHAYEKCSSSPHMLYRINSERNEQLSINASIVESRIISPSKEIMVTRIKMRRYRSRCSASDDPFTSEFDSCSGETLDVELTGEEVREMVKTEECKIGKICAYKSDCWGSGSLACLDHRRESKSPPRAFEHQYTKRVLALYSSCIQDWECFIEKIYANVWSVITDQGYNFEIRWRNGNSYRIEKQDQVIELSPREYLYIPPANKTHQISMAKCLSGQNRTICINLKDIEGLSTGDTFLVNNNGFGMVANNLIEVPLNGSDKSLNNPGESASIDSVWESITRILFSQEQSMFNSMIIQHEINEIRKWVHELIYVLSKDNPEILAKLLGGTFITKWLNKHMVLTYPCIHGEDDNPELCPKGMSNEVCKNITMNAKNITIFKDEALDVELLSLPRLIEADSEKENEQIEKIEEELRRKKESEERIENYNTSSFNWLGVFFDYFWKIGSLCGFIATILLMFGCHR